MRKVLGKKQSINNREWLEAMERIEDLVSLEELRKRVSDTVQEIRRMAKGRKAAYAWSGGKDSLVLGELCRMAGVTDCMMGVCDLEYPEFTEWVNAHKPEGIEIINTGQGLEWLAKHPEMLFPQESATAAKWFSIVQHRAQEKYYLKHRLDMIILGRRRADGNYCGRSGNLYTNRKGISRYSPLADWTHEEILAYIHYYGIPMPPIYAWKNGYLCGTHPWPARQWTGTQGNGWEEVYEIDPRIVENAARTIPEAAEYLRKRSADN